MSRFDELSVRDIMRTDLTTVSPETPVRELTRILSDGGISGVPVVTASGAVVGVVSSTDVVRLAAEGAGTGVIGSGWRPADATRVGSADEEDDDLGGASGFFLPEEASLDPRWDDGPTEAAFETFEVSDIMTPVSFSVPPTSSVRELADFLLRGRIHRAVVIDGGSLVGIVTTMDVLRALAEGGS